MVLFSERKLQYGDYLNGEAQTKALKTANKVGIECNFSSGGVEQEGGVEVAVC